jgi:hypothetical protein
MTLAARLDRALSIAALPLMADSDDEWWHGLFPHTLPAIVSVFATPADLGSTVENSILTAEWANSPEICLPIAAMTSADTAGADSDDDDLIWLRSLCRAGSASAAVGAQGLGTAGAGEHTERVRNLSRADLAFPVAATSSSLGGGRAQASSSHEMQLTTIVGVAASVPGAAGSASSASAIRMLPSRFCAAEVVLNGLVSSSPAVAPRFCEGGSRVTSRANTSMGELTAVYLQQARHSQFVSVGLEMATHLPVEGAPVAGPEWDSIVELAMAMVRSITTGGRQPAIFKLGITANPFHRFSNFDWGYRRDGYEEMVLLCATLPHWAVALERHLIAAFRSVSGCRNYAPGGESAPRVGPVFVYIVHVQPDALVEFRLQLARKRRRSSER